MNRGFAKSRLLLFGFALVLAIVLAPGIVQADTPFGPTTLTLSAPGQVALGSPVHVSATLLDSAGKPVSNATVVLFTSAVFMGVNSGPMEIARGTTDAAGTVDLAYTPTRTVTMEVRAEFTGDATHQSSAATTSFVVQPGNQMVTTQTGINIPFVNKWLLGGLLIIIWSLYLFVVSRVLRIAQKAR